MNEELRAFLATIWGEAAGSSPAARKAIASVILNRVGKREWRKLKTPLRVIVMSGFDAFTQQNKPFLRAWHYFDPAAPAAPGTANMALEALFDEVEPIYNGHRSVTTDAQLYFSPKAQAALHAQKPKVWPARPRWAFDLLEQVQVPGTEGDDFAWFRYKLQATA